MTLGYISVKLCQMMGPYDFLFSKLGSIDKDIYLEKIISSVLPTYTHLKQTNI